MPKYRSKWEPNVAALSQTFRPIGADRPQKCKRNAPGIKDYSLLLYVVGSNNGKRNRNPKEAAKSKGR
jgi:hypothetical protein